jgi:DNA polymerase-3 subunit epsilon
LPLLPILSALERRRIRRELPVPLRERLAQWQAQNGRARRSALREPLALARLVALDLETTGARMDRDRLLCIGAIAVRARTVRHDESLERFVRQEQSSSVANILIHQIGGQQQLGGDDPAAALVDCLEFLGSAVVVAYRAEFDATVLRRELAHVLGTRMPNRFVDLAVLLPALFPGTQNDTLEDWLGHFGLGFTVRHRALIDAYAHAALLLVVLERASRLGLHTTGELIRIEKAQRWLGLRR